MAWFTLLGFMGLYTVLGLLYLFLFGKIVEHRACGRRALTVFG